MTDNDLAEGKDPHQLHTYKKITQRNTNGTALTKLDTSKLHGVDSSPQPKQTSNKTWM